MILPYGYLELQKVDGKVRIIRQYRASPKIEPDQLSNLEFRLDANDTTGWSLTGNVVNSVVEKGTSTTGTKS